MPADSNSPVRPYLGISPTLAAGVYIDPSATVIGKVELGINCSVWPLCSVRGDVNFIRIGDRSNVQDGSVIHVSRPTDNNPDGQPTIIGDDVTVGHKVMLHGCRIGNRVLVGMGAIVMDDVNVEDDVIIAAGALVPPGKTLPAGYLYTGSPARQTRPLSTDEVEFLRESASNYVALKNDYID